MHTTDPNARINRLNCPRISALFCTRNSFLKGCNVFFTNRFHALYRGLKIAKTKDTEIQSSFFVETLLLYNLLHTASFCFHLILLTLTSSVIHSPFTHTSKQMSVSSSVDFCLLSSCLHTLWTQKATPLHLWLMSSFRVYISLSKPLSLNLVLSLASVTLFSFHLTQSGFYLDHFFSGLFREKHLTAWDWHPAFSFSSWL